MPSAKTTASAAKDKIDDMVDDVDSGPPILQKLREQTDAMVERMRPQIDTVAGYARDEPAKAMLISAAVGAGLMGLLALVIRSGSRTAAVPVPKPGTLSGIRDAALDLADRAHHAASKALASSQKQATSVADQATDAIADTWKTIRDQTDPVIERFRPQIDAVTSYAKEEPARAALGLAAAGAVLLGLFAMIGGSDNEA